MESEAWLMVGATQSGSGWLRHDGQRLSFDTGDDAASMSRPARPANVTFPWYYFGLLE